VRIREDRSPKIRRAAGWYGLQTERKAPFDGLI
jgi:hypothetical protein